MAAPESIRKLIEHFEQNREALRSGRYNEAQLRQEFLNPFFAALGWDMFNEQQYGEAYKEVIHETSVEVEGAAKAPDYAFRVGGVTKFFVEAKKPSVNIEHAIHPAYQVKRYAWSAKLPVAILSDFEEFAVYDCRSKPNPGDQAAAGRVMYLTYKDYLEKWDEIAAIFSKSAILKGAFDQYAQGVKGKRGTKAVDDAFLEEMEGWREALAKNLAIRNPGLENVRQLNYAVQMTIDRIVFLRICEDRGIEEEGKLKSLLSEPNIYERLCDLFRIADKRYNSGLFHFSDEKGQSSHPDDLTPCLKIDDKVLKEIISDLYYPSPYVFKLIPADILGQVYERFLGKVIRLTAGHQARVEEKPEVRKAGGVYYTPTYIVDYIVRNTVGKLLEGKTPAEAEALKIVDPACGSGSFLLGAFQYLIDWHNKYYREHDPEKWAKGGSPAIYRGQGGEWQLSTHEKKRILLNNLHGVDIDPQAVEVTKLSLLLKVLEEESGQLSLGFERALPDLGRNIQCGNSLIGPDYYDAQQLSMDFMDEEERQRVNAFDWRSAFPQVFAKGGFDAVIGNPPYGANINNTEKAYIVKNYDCQNYQLDSYLLFLEKSIKLLLKKNGLFGMIIPNPWLTNILQTNTRKFIVENSKIINIVHFYFPVFRKAIVDTEILILQNGDPKNWKPRIIFADSYESLEEKNNKSDSLSIMIKNQDQWRLSNGGIINIFLSESESRLAEKIASEGETVGNLLDVNVGIKPYQVGKGVPPQKRATVDNRDFDSIEKIDDLYRKYLRGKDINRYLISPKSSRFIKYGPWLAEPRPAAKFDTPIKLFIRQTGDSLIVALDNEKYLCLNNMHVLVPKNDKNSPYFFLGVLNSKLLNWYYHTLNPEVGEALAEVKKTNVEKLPIIRIDLSNAIDKIQYTKLVQLVECMLSLQKQNPHTPQEKETLEREIKNTDNQIDQLVYKLYGLTEEEIRVVEGEIPE